jgi:hypothetical protein
MRRTQIRRALGSFLGINVDQRDTIAASGEKLRRRPTDAIGGAGDRCYGAFIFHGPTSSTLLGHI